jgi:hypothetical protein
VPRRRCRRGCAAARRSATRSLASLLARRPHDTYVGDDAFDAAFAVEAHSSGVARSLFDPRMRDALLRLGESVSLDYDAGNVTVKWRPPLHDTTSFDAALGALKLALDWRHHDEPYR